MSGFENIVGNAHIINSLKNAVKYKRVIHAYIFSGAEGMGKMLLAQAFAKTLQCAEGGTEPCGHCRSCKTFESGNNPDIFYVKPLKTKGLGVDDMREQIMHMMETRPFNNPYKIFIIDNADTMTVQAQNAILKSMEEPSSFGIFILLAQNHASFLPTILSRCCCYKLKPVPEQSIREYLIREKGIKEQDAELLSVYSGGNIGRALKLAQDEGFISMRDSLIEMACSIKSADLIQVFSFFKIFDEYKERIQEALDILHVWYRDILVMQATGDTGFLVQPQMSRRLKLQADAYDARSLFQSLGAIEKAKRQLKSYANFQLTIEVMLLNIYGTLEYKGDRA